MWVGSEPRGSCCPGFHLGHCTAGRHAGLSWELQHSHGSSAGPHGTLWPVETRWELATAPPTTALQKLYTRVQHIARQRQHPVSAAGGSGSQIPSVSSSRRRRDTQVSLKQVLDPSTSALDTETGPKLAPSSCWQAGMGNVRPLAPGGNRAGGGAWGSPLAVYGQPARPAAHTYDSHAHNVTATLPASRPIHAVPAVTREERNRNQLQELQFEQPAQPAASGSSQQPAAAWQTCGITDSISRQHTWLARCSPSCRRSSRQPQLRQRRKLLA